MCGTASQVISWRLQVLSRLKEGLADTGGLYQDIVYNYEAAMSSGHSDRAGNDISSEIIWIYRSIDRRPVNLCEVSDDILKLLKVGRQGNLTSCYNQSLP